MNKFAERQSGNITGVAGIFMALLRDILIDLAAMNDVLSDQLVSQDRYSIALIL